MKKALSIISLTSLILSCTPKAKPSSPATRASKLEKVITKTVSADKSNNTSMNH
jgi:hypothetical protein